MLEGIVQKILQKVLGEYLDGFNSSNLNIGIWSGEVVIQNVRLKKSALLKFGLPIQLKYSIIKNLVLKIPWKSLTSSKTEMYLDGVYVVLGKVPENKWELKDGRIVEKRKKQVSQYAEALLKMFVQNQKKEQSKEQEQGFAERIILRIIDNLQVQVKNIHIRLEEPNYCSGITLENFKLTTVNKQGIAQYIDRSKPEFKNQPLRKKLQLKNFGVYSNMGQSSILQGDKTDQAMAGLIGINKGLKYLILLNFEASLLQMPKGQTDQPQIKLDLSIKKLEIQLQNKQVQQLIYFFESIQKYQKLLKKHNSLELSKEEKQKYISEFAQIYDKYYNRNQKFEGNQQERYEKILSGIASQQLYPSIKSIIQSDKVKKALEKKMTKKIAWFSYGKKDLSEKQTQQVQQFILDNFSEQVKIYKRPADYGFIQVNILMNEAAIFVGKRERQFYQGVDLKLLEFELDIKKRTGGLDVSIQLSDLNIDLVETSFIDQKPVYTNFFSKQTQDAGMKYINMMISTSPTAETYIDTKITGLVHPSTIRYNPILIQRITQFANLKISDQNADIALEKYNQIKDKTTEVIDQSINVTKQISVLMVDVTINAPLIIIPFPVKDYENYCWGIDMGQLIFQTDKSLVNPQMKKSQISSERYQIKLQNLNAGWYCHKDQLIKQHLSKSIQMKHQKLITDFGLSVTLQLSKKSLPEVPNVSVIGQMPVFKLNLSQFSYKMILSFAEKPANNTQQKKATDTITPHGQKSKEQIMKLSQKKDIIYYFSPTTKIWSKYFAVLKGNYIYLFESKTSETYDEYIYLKNSIIQQIDSAKCGRDFAIRIKNKISDSIISFSKTQNLQDWIKIIETKKTEQQIIIGQQEKKIVKKPSLVNPNNLKVSLLLAFHQVGVKFFKQEKQWMDISFGGFETKVQMFEYRKEIYLSLKQFTLDDTVLQYVNPQSDYLIKSGQKNGQFVNISIHQKDQLDPGYKQIVNQIDINIGMLWINLKPPVIKSLMQFFIPDKPEEQDKLDASSATLSTEVSATEEIFVGQGDDEKQNKIFVKLKFSVEDISLCLINTATQVRLTTISIKKLQLNMKQTPALLNLQGVLGDFNVTQQTNYPNTVVSQNESSQISYLIKTSDVTQKQLLSIDIKLLKGRNAQGKDILVEVTVKKLAINYFQQPVLRILDFLTLDLLPSLKKDDLASTKAIARATMLAATIPPEPPSIDIKVKVVDCEVMLKADPLSKDGLKLLISDVTVTNSSVWSKDYGIDKVLLQDYSIQIKKVMILRQYKQITNHMDITLKVHLIQNPPYYKNRNKSFKSQMRIECSLSPFLARINNAGFNFMMKILNHNIAYNDNCDQFYYPQKAQKQRQLAQKPKQDNDTIVFKLDISAITIAVNEANQPTPTSSLGLKDLQVIFIGNPQKTELKVTINDLSGSYFEQIQGKFHIKPMLKTSAIQQQRAHEKNQLLEIDDLVKVLCQMTESVNPINDITVNLIMRPNGDKIIDIRLEGLFIYLKLKPLLKLSRLANINPESEAPKPKYPPAVIKTISDKSTMKIGLILNNINIQAGSDETRRQSIKISTKLIGINLFMMAEPSTKQIKQVIKSSEDLMIANKIQLKMDEFNISLVQKIGNNTIQRTLLKPLSACVFKKGIYSVVESKCILSDDMQVLVSGFILQATTKDLIKLKVLYETNMAILQEDAKSQTQQQPKPIQAAQNSDQNKLNILADDQKVIKNLKGNIEVKGFTLKLLHHSEDLVLPVLMIDLHELNPIYRSNLLVDQFSLIVHVQFNYFNPRSSQWQPIFERMGIQINHIVTHKMGEGDQTLIVIENIEDVGLDEININVSSQFLTSLSQIIALNKKQMDKIQKNIVENQKIEVSPFVLENMTLSPIEVFTIQQDLNVKQLQKQVILTVKPREKKPIVVPLQEIQLKIKIDNNFHKINISSIGKRLIPNSDFIVDCQVQKLFKVIIITNHIIFENKLTKPLFIKSDKHQFVQVEPAGNVSISHCQLLSFGHQKQGMSALQKIEEMFIKNSVNFKAGRLFINVSKQELQVNNKKLIKFIVEAPIQLINLMPYSMLYQVIINNETKATKSLETMKQYEIFRHKKGSQMQLKINIPGFYWSHTIDLSKLNKDGTKLQRVQLKDQDLNAAYINIFVQIDSVTQSMEIVFFPSGYIINDTPYDILCFGQFEETHGKKNKGFYRLAGQQQIQSGAKIDASTIVFSSDLGKKLKFAHKQSPQCLTNDVQVAGIGDTQVQILIKQKQNEDIYDTYLTCIVDRSLKTTPRTVSIQKEVRITPKHIIENKTQKTLYISQKGSNYVFTLKPMQRRILFFFVKDNKKVNIKTQDSQLSADLEVDNFGVVNLYVNDNGTKRNFKMNVTSIEDYTYIAFYHLSEKQIPYRIRNNVKGLQVTAFIINECVRYGQQVAFLWKDPAQNHSVSIQLKSQETGKSQQFQINPDQISSSVTRTLLVEGRTINIKAYIYMNDNKKTIIIEQSLFVEEKVLNRVLSTINISMKKIGISLIINHSKILKPYQALFISFYNLQFIKQTTQIDETYQARVRFFQIDQNYPHLMAYPVVITPQQFKSFMGKDKKQTQRYLINALIKKDTRIQNATVLKFVGFEIQNICIKVSEVFIRLLLQVFSEFQSVMASLEEFKIVRKKDNWLKFEVPDDSKPVYIQQITISPFELQISLRLKQQNSEKSKMKLPFQNLINAFGVGFIQIQDAPIFLNGIKILNCFDSLQGIKSKIIQNYKWGVLKQFYKLIGAVDFIGNPIGLFKNISTGLADFVDKPAEGLVKGPLELGKGIAQGGYSLVAHTLGGALYSFDKMSGALSTGLAFLCLDPQFEEKREKQKSRKPKNVIQGLQKGAKAILSGFKQGITGIFLKPYQNASKDGFLGFLKGTYQGLTGVVIKPITGILDFASKTTQGLKNTMMFFEDKPNQSRMRCPRPFYGQNSLLKQYNTLDAQIMNVLQFVKKAQFAQCKFINVFMIQMFHKDKQSLEALVILDNYIVNLSFQKKQVFWYVQIKNVLTTSKQSDSVLKISLKKSNKHFTNAQVIIQNLQQSQLKLIQNTIDQRLDKINSIISI